MSVYSFNFISKLMKPFFNPRPSHLKKSKSKKGSKSTAKMSQKPSTDIEQRAQAEKEYQQALKGSGLVVDKRSLQEFKERYKNVQVPKALDQEQEVNILPATPGKAARTQDQRVRRVFDR